MAPEPPAPEPLLDLAPLETLVATLAPGAPLVAKTMPGGASTRRYFRVWLPNAETVVAMYVPEGAKPEEVHTYPRTEPGVDSTPSQHAALLSRRWPFLEVRDLLAEHGVDVPNILAEDTTHGWLVIEDLGDETLANWLLKNPGDREALYTKAVRDLARAQNELASLPTGCVVASRTFDFDLLRWEIEHFREWGIDARGKKLAAEDVPRWNVLADRLAKRVASLPSGFVHRDYQSRNIMVVPHGKDRRLVWIDFQDALLGPRVYDLVALLNDSYQEFDRAFVEARLAEYADAAALPHSSSDPEGRGELHGEFDLVTIQRKLKDAGRFVFIDRQKGNPSFLRFVEPTILKVGGALARLASSDPDMADLRSLLKRTLGNELPG